MARRFLFVLIAALLLTGCARAAELTLKVSENIQPYAVNTASLQIPVDGLLSVWLEDGVMEDTVLLQQTPVSSGDFSFTFSACAEDGTFLPRGDYALVATLLSGNGQGFVASAKVHVTNPKAAVLYAVPDTDTMVSGKTKIRFELCLSRETDMKVVLLNSGGEKLRTWNIHREGLAESVFTYDGLVSGKPIPAGDYVMTFAIKDNDPGTISIPFHVVSEESPAEEILTSPTSLQELSSLPGRGIVLSREDCLAVLCINGEAVASCPVDGFGIPYGIYPITGRKYSQWENGICTLYNLSFGDGYRISGSGFRNKNDTAKRLYCELSEEKKQTSVCLPSEAGFLTSWQAYSSLSTGDWIAVVSHLSGDLPSFGEEAPAAVLPDGEICLTFVGDCVLGSEEKTRAKENSFDSTVAREELGYPFRNVQEYFQNDDLTMINLECVLKNDASGKVEKSYNFRGPTDFAQMLPASDIELCNIANNHYIDYGASGRASTCDALDDVGIPYSGYRALYVYEKNGIRVGFAGIRETTYKQNPSWIAQDIKALKHWGCDVIVYTAHFGNEYERLHNELQTKIAHLAIDAGANIVVGAHPHVVQGLEEYNGGVIFYSLGNFVFGGNLNLTEFDGLLVQTRLTFAGGTYQGTVVSLVPVLTTGAMPANDFSPVPASVEDYDRIMEKLQKDSSFPLDDIMFFAAKP